MFTRSKTQHCKELKANFEELRWQATMEREGLYERSPSEEEADDQLALQELEKKIKVKFEAEKKLMKARRRLKYAERYQIIILRFGQYGETKPTGLTYKEIGKRLMMRLTTVQRVCLAYIHRGGCLLAKEDYQSGRPQKLTEAQQRWICSHKVLQLQAPLSIRQRCRELERKFGVKITGRTLMDYYKRHKITWKKVKVRISCSLSDEELQIRRISFLQSLYERLMISSRVIYIDETSTNLWA